MADLDDILAGGASAPASETTQPEQQPAEPEQGDATQEGATEQGTVPVAALQAERAKAKRYTEAIADFDRRLQEQDARWAHRFEQLTASLQPKQPAPAAPDFWEDPQKATTGLVQEAITPIQQAMIAQREQMSLMFANEKHGPEKVVAATEALKALQSDRAQFDSVYRQIMASPHPYGALVEWHGKHQVLAKIGNDPEAYIEQEVQRRLAEMQKDSGQQQVAQAPAAMPSNFATARNVGSRSGPAWGGPTPLADIFSSR